MRIGKVSISEIIIIIKMKVKHRQYLQQGESKVSDIPPRKFSRQIDRSFLEEKQNQSSLNSEQHPTHKSQSHDAPPSSGELDYLRLIREKEETIRQLTQMLEHINLSSQGTDKVKQLTATIKEYESQVDSYEHQLREWQGEVKVLRIENECLIRVIEKNEVNLPSHRESILQREITELRESLTLAEKQLEETRHNSENASEKMPQSEDSYNELRERNRELTEQNRELQSQCDKLIGLLKDREGEESKKACCWSCRSGQRVTLNKIKQQYNENIKLTRQYFYQQVQHLMEQHQQTFKKACKKLDLLSGKVSQLQNKRSNSSKPKPVQQTASLQIQYLLQKYYQAEKVLQQQKEVNSRLQNQLEMAQKTLRQLSIRSMEGSELLDISCSLRKVADWSGSARLAEEMTRLREAQLESKQLQQDIADLKGQLSTEKSNNQLKLGTIVSCYENQLNDKVKNILDQSKQIAELQQLASSLRQQIQQMEVIHQNLSRQNLDLKKYIQRQSAESSAKDHHITRIQAELESLTLKSESELNHLKSLIHNYEEKFGQLSSNYNCRIQQLQVKLSNIHSELIEAQQTVNKQQQQLREERERIRMIKEFTGFSLEGELEALKEAVVQMNIQDLKQSQRHQASAELQWNLELKIDEGLKMAQQLQELRSDICAKQQHNVSLSTHIDTLQRQIETLRQQVRQKSMQNSYLTTEKYLIEARACKTNKKFVQGQPPGIQAFMTIIDRLLKVQAKRKAVPSEKRVQAQATRLC